MSKIKPQGKKNNIFGKLTKIELCPLSLLLSHRCTSDPNIILFRGPFKRIIYFYPTITTKLTIILRIAGPDFKKRPHKGLLTP